MTTLMLAALQSHALSEDAGAGLLGLHRAADGITALSYFGIAGTLTYLVYRLRQQLPFGNVFLLFGAFIVLCGATHFTSLLMLGDNAPRLVVTVSVVTAAVSLLTALVLPSYIPKVVAFAASAEAARDRDVANARASALEEANETLTQQAQVLAGTNALLEESLQARRSIEAQYRATFEQAAVGIAHVSLDGRWLRVNQRLCEIFGYEPNALLARTHESTTHPDDRAGDLLQLGALLAGTNAKFSREKRFVDAEGDVVWVNVSVTLVRDPATEPAYFIAVVEDIRARKAAELAVLEASRRKDHFLAILSHELRNPLAPVRAGVELLQSAARNQSDSRVAAPGAVKNDDVAARVLPIMERQIAHMTRLLDDLLDASRLDHDKVELRLQPVEAVALIMHAADSMRPLIEKRGLTLTTTIADGPLMITADPVRLTQMVANLLDNAAKFTQHGGRVDVHLSRDDDAALISVRDTGIGLAPQHLARVFEPFEQIESALSRHHGGLGIGLSLVRAFAERQGASVYAQSNGLGSGSTFSIRFPLAAPLAEAGLPLNTSGQSVSPSDPMRVLVVDDSVDASIMMAALIEGSGRAVRTVHDGQSAVRAFCEFRPQAVLLDLGMPGMDGFETCRRIRATEDGESAIMIALTGWGRQEDREQTRAAGFDLHLVKPVDFGAITQALEFGATARQAMVE